jgi:cell division septum initiation protein DivIVA
MTKSVAEEIEDALQLLVSAAEQIAKMKKELKQTVSGAVSTLRDLIVKLHVSRESKADEISKLEKQVDELKAELNDCRHSAAKVLGTPFSVERHEPAGQFAVNVAPQWGKKAKLSESDKMNGKAVVLTDVTKLYSDLVGSGVAKKLFHLSVKSKGNTIQEKATELLKAKINPTEKR